MSSIYSMHKPQSGGEYLKIKDGEKIRLRIASEPAISVYKSGDKPRYSWVVFNRENNMAQVYTSGVSVYSQIAALVEDWGDPTEFDVKISRTGSTMNDTEYFVTPVKESKNLTDSELEAVNKIDLLKAVKGKLLSEYVKDKKLPEPSIQVEQPEEEQANRPVSLDDIPF